MTISVECLEQLNALGLSLEQAVKVTHIIKSELRRTYERDRKHQYRMSQLSLNVPDHVPALSLNVPDHVPNPQANLLISPGRSRDVRAHASLSKKDIRKILETCLSTETAQHLLEHRIASKVPLTEGAAKALVKAFQKYGNAEAAASEMMVRGWRGFKPEWMASDGSKPKSTPSPEGRKALDNFRADQRKSEAVNPQALQPIDGAGMFRSLAESLRLPLEPGHKSNGSG